MRTEYSFLRKIWGFETNWKISARLVWKNSSRVGLKV